MQHWICVTCGTQFAASEAEPPGCPICLDARQYVGHEGQQWTTLARMQQEGYRNRLTQHEAHLIGIGTEPRFAIGQRALLLQTEKGNILWDCITYLDDETKARVRELGGIAAVAISHPHYYSCMIEWANYFDAPIFLHEADREWVMRPSERIVFWSGETRVLLDEIRMVRLGGHFPGSAVLHWPQADDGQGVLLTGDTIYVVADRNWVSFMYSYPNLIPLPAAELRRIRETITPYSFDRLYAGWFDTIVAKNAREVVLKSVERYIGALADQQPG